MIEEYLREIGLSKNETKIYLALLELGPSTIGEISSKTKIHRRNVYDSVDQLKEKGFVSWTIKNNRKYFEAANPQRIADILNERKEKLLSILPQLINKRKNTKDSQNVRVYTGLEGRKLIFEDKLRYKSEQLVLGAHEPSERSNRYMVPLFHKKRIRKKIPLKMLFPENQIEAARRFRKLKYVKVRIIPNKFNSPIAINIYANKVAFLLDSGKESPLSILIEDKNLSNNFKNYFFTLWKTAKII